MPSAVTYYFTTAGAPGLFLTEEDAPLTGLCRSSEWRLSMESSSPAGGVCRILSVSGPQATSVLWDITP